MEVAWPGGSRQRWVGNQASEPSTLEEAKQAATAMLSKKQVKVAPRDWIKELNQTAANEVERAVVERQRRQWPLNLMGMNNKQSPRWKVDPKSLDREAIQAVLDTERVLIDERVTPAPCKATTTRSNGCRWLSNPTGLPRP
jgi:hypothetical protein